MVRAALAVMAAGLAACASRPVPQPQPAPDQPPAAVPAPGGAPPVRVPSAPTASAPPAASAARSVDAYKREVAQRIHEVSSEQVFPGAPPNPLRSVVVVNLSIDSRGGLIDARVLRDNGDAELTRVALESARRAAPYAAPAYTVARRGRVEFFETWLFSNDGRFRLRTLAEAQQP